MTLSPHSVKCSKINGNVLVLFWHCFRTGFVNVFRTFYVSQIKTCKNVSQINGTGKCYRTVTIVISIDKDN